MGAGRPFSGSSKLPMTANHWFFHSVKINAAGREPAGNHVRTDPLARWCGDGDARMGTVGNGEVMVVRRKIDAVGCAKTAMMVRVAGFAAKVAHPLLGVQVGGRDVICSHSHPPRSSCRPPRPYRSA